VRRRRGSRGARRIARGAAAVAITALGLAARQSSSRAEPYRLRADAFAEAPPAAGFVALSGEARERGDLRLDAEALVWTGVVEDEQGGGEARGEAVVASVRVGDAARRADVTFGRQLYYGGAIRPTHFDGARAAVRSAEGGEIEAFGGIPVQPGHAGRTHDWLLGYRFTHRAEDVGRFGFSFLQQRDGGRRAREELGVEGTMFGGEVIALTGTAALDVLRGGLAEARASFTVQDGVDRLELFGVRRSPSRMLPATSLFAAIGSWDTQALGTSGSWRVAPRLDLHGMLTVEDVARSLGATQLARAELRLDDEGRGAIGLEGRRVWMPDTSWSGGRAYGRIPLLRDVAGSAEVEVAVPDEPGDRGAVWPWGLLALRWVPAPWLEAAAGVEASASPAHASSVGGLARVSGQWGAP
jgi:hypothetical protein